MSAHLNHHISGWVEKIHANIKEFRLRTDVTNEEKVTFILRQYFLILLIYQALNKQILFVGAKIVNSPATMP